MAACHNKLSDCATLRQQGAPPSPSALQVGQEVNKGGYPENPASHFSPMMSHSLHRAGQTARRDWGLKPVLPLCGGWMCPGEEEEEDTPICSDSGIYKEQVKKKRSPWTGTFKKTDA